MPEIRPIDAIGFSRAYPTEGVGDISALIAPPYDVLDEGPKQALLEGDANNIVAIDLPFTPPKVVGPDAVYDKAGEVYARWLKEGVLTRRPRPAMFVYEQVYTHAGKTYHRRGLIANLRVQEYGKGAGGRGGIWPHEQTFSSGKEDRLKLMRACRAQLSPIFGLYSDAQRKVGALLEQVVRKSPPTFLGATANDKVKHRVWEVADPALIAGFTAELAPCDVYIADGHHRYHTALNYRNELAAKAGELADSHRANGCFFVLVAMEDPGMIVLPTHRVLGGMKGLSFDTLVAASAGQLNIERFAGEDLDALEKALPAAEGHPALKGSASKHAMGLYLPAHSSGTGKPVLALATPVRDDPLAQSHARHDKAWRTLDVAIVQHVLVERICQPTFCQAGQPPAWKFPHATGVLRELCDKGEFQLGVIVQPTPLASVKAVSLAGELMPQKSTFFYPKLATGLVINPLE